MLRNLISLFSDSSKPSATNDPEKALRLAAATLMIEVSRSDGHIDDLELTTLGQWLSTEFELSQDEVAELTSQAQIASHEALSLQGFTRQIVDQWSSEQRMKLIEYCWRIALVDEHLDAHERHTIRKIAGLLYLNDKEIVLAKHAATQAQSSDSD